MSHLHSCVLLPQIYHYWKHEPRIHLAGLVGQIAQNRSWQQMRYMCPERSRYQISMILGAYQIVIAASVNFPMLILSVYWPGPPLRLKKWISPHRKTIRGAGIPLSREGLAGRCHPVQ